MTKVTLDDLKFIEDPRNRKAFLIALREVEEEGFDISEAQVVAKKIQEIEKTPDKPKNNPKEELATKVVGSTPAERAAASISKRKFTNTNAVDMKDYKYWRDPDFDKPTNASNNHSSSRSPFEPRTMFDEESERTITHSSQKASKRSSLYEELFGEAKEHEVEKTKSPSNLYKQLDDLVKEESKNEKDKTKTPLADSHENKFLTDEYKQKAKNRAEAFKKRLEEEEQLKEAKRLEDEAKRLEEERKALQAKRVELEAREAEAAANEKRLNETKLLVEVVAPENVPSQQSNKKAPAKKKTTPSKPRKRKKKFDADIKLYRNIHID